MGPERFIGWFQPWVVALIVGVPSILLLIYRRRDIGRFLRSRDWKRRASGD